MISMCLSVAEDLANHQTDMVFLYSKDSYRSRKTILGDGTSYLSRDIAPRKKIQNINTSFQNFRPKDAGDLIIFCAGRLWSGHSSIGSG